MKGRGLSRSCRVVLAAVVAAGPASAWCALGGQLPSVMADGSALHAAVRSETTSVYTRHSMTLPTGTRVNEYAGADGVVFAVTWSGATSPDLSQLLGTYFSEYKTALPGSASVPHRARTVQGPRVVVQSAGIMRALHGRAYVPAALPAGVSVGGLQ